MQGAKKTQNQHMITEYFSNKPKNKIIFKKIKYSLLKLSLMGMWVDLPLC